MQTIPISHVIIVQGNHFKHTQYSDRYDDIKGKLLAENFKIIHTSADGLYETFFNEERNKPSDSVEICFNLAERILDTKYITREE